MAGPQPVTVTRIQEGSAPLAQLEGATSRRDRLLQYLDDDEYLPGSLDERLLALQSDPDSDLVVCNGWRHREGHDEPAFNYLAESRVDPLRALLQFADGVAPNTGGDLIFWRSRGIQVRCHHGGGDAAGQGVDLGRHGVPKLRLGGEDD